MPSSTSSSEAKPAAADRGKGRFVLLVAGFLLLDLAFVHCVNYVVDPLQIFRKQTRITPLFSEDQRHQVPGLVRHYARDAHNAIVGASMTSNIRASRVSEIFGGETIKLSIDGSTPSEQFLVASELMEAADGRVERVIWAVDTLAYNAKHGSLSQSEDLYPLHLYGDGLELAEYTLNIDTLLHSVQTVVAHWTGIGFFRLTPSIDDLNTWEKRSIRTGCRVTLNAYHRVLSSGGGNFDIKTLRADNLAGHLRDIERLARDNPRTVFHFFFPPLSVLRLKLFERYGQLDLFGEVRDRFAAATMRLPNVQLYDFQVAFDLTENLDYFRDTGHYDARVNRRILEAIAAGRSVRSSAEIESASREIVARTRAYDVDAADAACGEPRDAAR